jgi:rare lipoprotein A
MVTVAACAGRDRVARPSPPPPSPPAPAKDLDTTHGLASYYGGEFHGKITASGVPFDMHAMVAAHPTFPFGTLLRVTNLANRRRVTVRVVDRGPASSARADGVVIDLSYGAASALRFLRQGRTRVRIEVLRWGS